jgi:N-acetyl-anhydromuramyl-L-alanine amidase AmpD
MDKLDVKKIVQERLNASQFFQEEFTKDQIYIHHTAGNGNAVAVAKSWNSNPERIATAFVIGEDGTIVQCFSSKHWAYHLGLKNSHFSAHGVPFKQLDKISIGIEVCNWGPITEKDGKFYNYVGRPMKSEEIVKLDTKFRGHQYWHKYHPAQIESLRKLLVYLCETYNIPMDYNEDMWDISKDALRGVRGVYTHVSVRPDKSDMYPCPNLIKMLKSLSGGKS